MGGINKELLVRSVMDRLGLLLLDWLCCVLLLSCCCPCWSQPCPLLSSVGASEEDKTGCYMVSLKKDTNESSFTAIKSTLQGLSTDSRLHGSVQGLVQAITVPLNKDGLNLVSMCSHTQVCRYILLCACV